MKPKSTGKTASKHKKSENRFSPPTSEHGDREQRKAIVLHVVVDGNGVLVDSVADHNALRTPQIDVRIVYAVSCQRHL